MKQTLFLFGLVVWTIFLAGCGSSNKTTAPIPQIQVTPDVISATASKMNVLYIGVENPVKLNIPSVALNSLQVTGTGGGVKVKKVSDRNYILTVRKPGETTLSITGKGYKKDIPFKVKRIPDPVARVGKSAGGAMGNGEFKAQGGVGAFLDDFDFDARCSIQGYRLTRVAKRQDPVESLNSGARYNAKSKRLIRMAKPGDTYLFTNVKARCPGDPAGRRINTMVFNIK